MAWASVLLTSSADVSAFQATSGSRVPVSRRISTVGSTANTNTAGASPSLRALPLSSASSGHRRSGSSSQLKYSDGSEAASASGAQSTPWSWLFSSSSDVRIPSASPITTPDASSSSQEQEVVDEYLEFLDRRYRRLHEAEHEKEVPAGAGFSAFSWLGLSEKPSRNDVAAQEQTREDALYVLGVAGLASQRLLQKHHMATQQSLQSRMESVMDATIVAPPALVQHQEHQAVELTKTQKLANQVLLPVVRVLYIAEYQKKLFLQTQSRRFKSLLSLCMRQMAKAPSAGAKALLDFGGGRANLVRTIALASGLILFLRPVLEAAIRERTMML